MKIWPLVIQSLMGCNNLQYTIFALNSNSNAIQNGFGPIMTFFSLPSSVTMVPQYTTSPFGATYNQDKEDDCFNLVNSLKCSKQCNIR